MSLMSLQGILDAYWPVAEMFFPGLKKPVMRPCCEADKEHVRSPRQYMHVFHVPGVICYAADAEKLPAHYQRGLVAHEFGHILAKEAGLRGDQETAANQAAWMYLGACITYEPPLMLESVR